MKAEEFERQVIAGEITDFEPYLTKTGNIKNDLFRMPYRLVLLRHGIETERILELDGTFAINTCIREGLLPERYDEWKDRNEEWILETFAKEGYYLDELIESEYDDIREIVIENHPEFGIERLNRGKDYQIIYDYIKNEVKPNLELFKAYIDTLTSNSNDMGLMTKYRALTEVPSTIEKTMSDAQLFESGSPLWATDLKVQQINDVLDACKELERQGYSGFVEYLLTQVREPDYDRERAFTDLPVLSINYQWYKLEHEMRKNQ